MRNLGKVMKAALIEDKSLRQELYKFLRNYMATPHLSTGIAPATALFNREMRIKQPNTITQTQKSPLNTKLTTNDKHEKDQMKSYADKKRHHTPNASRKHSGSMTTQER